MKKDSRISTAFLKIRDDTTQEIINTEWWRFRRVNHLRNRLRWANYHYNKNKKKEEQDGISK